MRQNRAITSVLFAITVLVIANSIFYALPGIRWRYDQPGVVREINARNDFWKIASPWQQEVRDQQGISTKWTGLGDDYHTTNSNWITVAHYIHKQRSEVVTRRWTSHESGWWIFATTTTTDASWLGTWYVLLVPSKVPRDIDGRLDWAIHWRRYHANDAAIVDFNGTTTAERGTSCVMGQRFTRTFHYELATTQINGGGEAVQLPTDRPIPPTPFCIITWDEGKDPSIFQIFPIGWRWSSILSAVLQLVLLALIWYYISEWTCGNILLQRRAQRAPGPLEQELQLLLTLRVRLERVAAGYKRPDLPELVRIRELITRVEAANRSGKMRDRAEPDSPVATTLESATATMDAIEALLEVDRHSP